MRGGNIKPIKGVKMEQNIKDEIINMVRKTVQEIVIFDEKENLKFKKVGENVYRVFNTKTKRFHDLELGIDIAI